MHYVGPAGGVAREGSAHTILDEQEGDHDHGSTHRDEEPTRLGAVGAAGKPKGKRRDSRQEGVME